MFPICCYAPEARCEVSPAREGWDSFHIRCEPRRGDTLSHTYAQNIMHVVFSTKERQRLIEKKFQPPMWSYVAGICKGAGIFVHNVGGMENHIHLLIQVPPVLPLAKAVMTIKTNSSKWANGLGRDFAWQQGYGAFGVSWLPVAWFAAIHTAMPTPDRRGLRGARG